MRNSRDSRVEALEIIMNIGIATPSMLDVADDSVIFSRRNCRFGITLR